MNDSISRANLLALLRARTMTQEDIIHLVESITPLQTGNKNYQVGEVTYPPDSSYPGIGVFLWPSQMG
jgi:hypothetical protein